MTMQDALAFNDLAMRDSLAVMMAQTATVYVPNGTDRKYDQQVHTGLACSLQPVGRSNTLTTDQRAQLVKMGVLYFDPAYTMPDYAEIVVDSHPGVRWRVQFGTVWPDIGAGGQRVAWHADVVKQ